MTNLKIRRILISDLELFHIKGASFEENETCFLYKGVSCMQEPTVVPMVLQFLLLKISFTNSRKV